jgi:hypothetical protein
MTFQRDDLIKAVADKMTDAMDMESLLQYYYEGTISFLEDLTDSDLLDQADWFEVNLADYGGYQEDMFNL